jgi:hypothetical protein
MKKMASSVAIGLTLTVFVVAQQTSATSQQKNQSMEGMQGQHGQMNGMMQDCHKNMQSLQQSNDSHKARH